MGETELGCSLYDSEKDPSGAIGIGLANAAFLARGRIVFSPQSFCIGDNLADGKIIHPRYLSFCKDVRSKGIRVDGYGPLTQDLELKRELLVKYFPRQFGEDGRQPIVDANSTRVGVTFRRVYAEAVRCLEENE